MRISAKVAILLLLGLASKEEYTLAHQLQQTSALTIDQQQRNGLREQKVARPTSISFDQLRVQEDTLGADLDNAQKNNDQQKLVDKKQAEALEAASKALNKQPASNDEDNDDGDDQKKDDPTNKLNQVSSDQKSEEQVDQTEESKLADQIRNQAKAIADEQSKQQQKDQAAGKLKISSAAAALNNAEMGIESAAEESEANKNEIDSISSDQLYVGDKNNSGKKDVDEPVAAGPTNGEPTTEAAAITMAKEAAKNVVEGKDKKPADGANKDSSEIKKAANVEIEQSADLESNSQEMADAGLSRQNSLVEDKSQMIEEIATAAGGDKNEKNDLAVPNWPKYSDPVGQRAEIDKELKQVKQQTEEFKKNSEEAETQIKNAGAVAKTGTEFEQKQKEIDVQHKATVNKIKSEIWGDRLIFLQKMIKLSEENKQDGQEAPPAPPIQKASVVPQAQALAQQSTKGKTQDEEETSLAQSKSKTKTKSKNKSKNKKETIKKDLIHRIDTQLTKLKNKNKSSKFDDEDGAADVPEVSEEKDETETMGDDKAETADTSSPEVSKTDGLLDLPIRTSSRYGKYMDSDADEYAVNRHQIHNRVDGYGGRRDLDLYDIFKDFDKDGDGIVDDIDLDDPQWMDSCKKNNYYPLEQYDDSMFRAGRYRGLTEEEWTQRESQHQRNLDELMKKQKELEDAHKEVHEALTGLTSEKDNIDKEIKEKVLETEKMRVEFRKKAAERAQAERQAQMEREKAMMVEKQEERKRKAQQIRETEQIEGKAIQLHGKAKELQRQKLLVKDARVEVAEEIRKLKANIQYAQRAKQAAVKIKERIAERKEWMKKHREDQLELRKQQREMAMKEAEAERERRERLQESCPHSKVRSYACNADGLRLVKVFRYIYDFDYNKCVPKVQRKTQSCKMDSNPYDLDGDGIDDVTGYPVNDYNRWKFDTPYSGGKGGRGYPYDNDQYYRDYADQYNWQDHDDYGAGGGYSGGYGGAFRHADEFSQRKSQAAHQKSGGQQSAQQKSPESAANNKEQGEALTAEEEQELKNLPDSPDQQAPSPSPKHFSKKHAGPKHAPAPRKPNLAAEEEVSADSADQYDVKAGANKGNQNVVQKSKKSMKKQQKTKPKPKMKKETVDESAKEKTQEEAGETNGNTADSNIESQSNKQIEQLNEHLGAIEGKVSEITKKYEELKKADETKDQTIKKLSETRVQMSSSSQEKSKSEEKSDLKSVDKSKIQKFAKMLKTLNQYKTQYKKAKSQSEKKKIHEEVVHFTQKWLDAKNLLLQSQIEFKPPSDSPIVNEPDATMQQQRDDLNHDVIVRNR